MAGVTGLEPAASGVTGQRSNQLSYTPVLDAASSKSPLYGCQARLWVTFPSYRHGLTFANLIAVLKANIVTGLVGDDRLELPTLSV